jgi:hypothetical protein
VTVSTDQIKAVAGFPLKPGNHAHIHFDGTYWDYKGIAPDGSLRLYDRAGAPYLRTVHHLQPDGTWRQRPSTGGIRPAAWWTAAAAIALYVVVTLAFSDRPNPGALQWGHGLAYVVAAGALVLFALPSGVCVDSWDQTAIVDAGPPPQSYEDYLKQFKEEDRFLQIIAWQKAIHAQVSGRHDPAGPFGQYPTR